MTAMLEGKVVAVTGGASGIGRGIALAAARHGAKAVIIGDLHDQPREGGETTHALIALSGGTASFRKADVTSRADMDALVAEAEAFGGIDLMVCNAGIAVPDDGPEIAPDVFRKLIAINQEGALLSAQAAIAAMIARGKGGSVVMISSMGGLRGAGFTTGYSATKGAVNMMTAALADAHGPQNIRVNAVCPGLIHTALIESSPAVAAAIEPMCQRMPLRRLGQPSEVGDVVAWLGSPFSSFVTGVTLPVDGGQTAIL
ncbi:SDR family oxidoreductase [Sphingobium cupriresistens]|uniref:3-ketoacyl-ACP reductase n=1 Tax=Sphingobium cupriresistens LL01 TaxID=1420583 RepID=A0A0J7Y3E7_9SPHN|nr:SDR family oxidoreductase [Sphingobium cupriresistens]KMS58217.1 3-ketoacyl-ACP reductase [Sphingobium cupriresistens LL01]